MRRDRQQDATRRELSQPWQDIDSGRHVEDGRTAHEIEGENPLQNRVHDALQEEYRLRMIYIIYNGSQQ